MNMVLTNKPLDASQVSVGFHNVSNDMLVDLHKNAHHTARRLAIPEIIFHFKLFVETHIIRQ